MRGCQSHLWPGVSPPAAQKVSRQNWGPAENGKLQTPDCLSLGGGKNGKNAPSCPLGKAATQFGLGSVVPHEWRYPELMQHCIRLVSLCLKPAQGLLERWYTKGCAHTCAPDAGGSLEMKQPCAAGSDSLVLQPWWLCLMVLCQEEPLLPNRPCL